MSIDAMDCPRTGLSCYRHCALFEHRCKPSEPNQLDIETEIVKMEQELDTNEPRLRANGGWPIPPLTDNDPED